jgi:hypothetical protein
MTGEAGRRQGGNVLPLNRPEEKHTILSTGSLVVAVTAICVVCGKQDYLSHYY